MRTRPVSLARARLLGSTLLRASIALCLLALTPVFAPGAAAAPPGDCPNIGLKPLPPLTQGASAGAVCGSGLTFTFNGVTYKSSQSLCPPGIFYTPRRNVPDPALRLEGYRPSPAGLVHVVYQPFSCRACDWFGSGIFTCCSPYGVRQIIGTLPHYARARCSDGSGRRSTRK